MINDFTTLLVNLVAQHIDKITNCIAGITTKSNQDIAAFVGEVYNVIEGQASKLVGSRREQDNVVIQKFTKLLQAKFR